MEENEDEMEEEGDVMEGNPMETLIDRNDRATPS